jgi:Transglycosylase-like domain
MRRALAIALTTSVAMPVAAAADTAVKQADLSARPAVTKALATLKRVHRARTVEKKRRQEQRVAIPAHLAAIAACESGMNPQAVSADGQYHGLFQFDQGTWSAVGGQGDPAAASVAEQVKRAEILYAQSGPGQWPVCGT